MPTGARPARALTAAMPTAAYEGSKTAAAPHAAASSWPGRRRSAQPIASTNSR